MLFRSDVEAGVGTPHDVTGAGVEKDVGGVEPAHADQTHAVSAERGPESKMCRSVSVCVCAGV